MNFSQLIRPPGIEENPFGGRRLSGVNMGHYANIAHIR
jgi:hypothetical protein